MSGLYGKLPAHGDFVARGISVPVRRKLDVWLSKLASFPLPDDGLRGQITLGSEMWLVLVLPSNDRPGRQFPLALLCPFAANDHTAAEAWCNAALAAFRQESDQNADTLFASLPARPETKAVDLATDTLWLAGQSPMQPDHIFRDFSFD